MRQSPNRNYYGAYMGRIISKVIIPLIAHDPN